MDVSFNVFRIGFLPDFPKIPLFKGKPSDSF